VARRKEKTRGRGRGKVPEQWERYRKDARARERLQFRFGRAAQAGVFTAEVYHEDLAGPLAVVWLNYFGLGGIQILNSFVFEYVRRCGLRTFIHEKLLACCNECDLILSGAGTESGAAWMKATGYVKNKNGWEFRRPKKRSR
jgi:hypothetical protein